MTETPHSLSQTLITGVYRSGTEFVSLLISGHPELSTTMYHVNVLRFLARRHDPIERPDNLRRAISETAARLYRRYGFQFDEAAVAARCQAAGSVTYGVLYDALMSVLWLRGEKRHWAEKCQLLWREIPEFIDMMANGRVVLVLRDPRSVLASFKRYTYVPPPAYLGAVFNCLDAMAKGQAYRETLPADRLTIVRYEDAARDPKGTAARLYEFLGLDPSLDPQDRSQWKDSHGRPWTANTVFGANDSSFDVDRSIDRWRDNLEDWEVGLAEAVCGPEMEAFGYGLAGIGLDWPAALRVILADGGMTAHLRRFLAEGEGIQAFPTDPLDGDNWEENVLGQRPGNRA